jgi:hypothetical protein
MSKLSRLSTRRVKLAGVGFLLLLCATQAANAGISAPARPEEAVYKNSVGIGIAAGWVEEGNGHSFGLSVDYTRLVSDRWAVSGLVSFDRFHESVPDDPTVKVDTLTVAVTGSYAISTRFAVTTGFGQVFADDADGRLGFTNGSKLTGVILSYSVTGGFPFWARDSVSFSAGYIYDLDGNLGSVSFGVGLGFGF